MMSWWPFSLITTFWIILVAFSLLYVWAWASLEMQKQKQKAFRETQEYRDFRDRMDSLK